MSSQLAAIYAALAAQIVTVGTVPVSAQSGAALSDSVESAQLPVRLLLPVGGKAAGSLQGVKTFGGGGKTPVLTVDWTLTDLLLWRAIGAGVGLTDLAPELISYCAAYLSVVGPLRTPTWSVTGITFPAIGGLEWPAQSDRWYSGVQAQLTIREIVGG
jgi:hypothetical protein